MTQEIIYNSVTATHIFPHKAAGAVARNDSGTDEGTHPWVRMVSTDGCVTWTVTFHPTEEDADQDTNGIDERNVSELMVVTTP